jgi:hypothetical protein
MKQIVAVAGALLMSALGVNGQQDELHGRHAPKVETITFISDDKFRYNHDDWTDVKEITSSKALHELVHNYKPLDHKRRPVYGVLTEPIRGNLKKGEGEKAEKIDNADLSYVPKAHV